VKNILILIFLTAMPNFLFSENYEYRNPFLAGVLSWTMPGAGQFYAKSYVKGSFFVMTEIINKSVLFLMASYLRDNYTKNTKESVTINWSSLSLMDKGLVVGYIITSLAWKVYVSLDAIHSAEKYNRLMNNNQSIIITPEFNTSSCGIKGKVSF